MRIAESIISHRPYSSVDDLRSVPWVTSVGFQLLKTKVTCVPVVEEKKKTTFKMKPAPNVEKAKVNINTANGPTITQALGCNKAYAGYIVTHRNKNGEYTNLEELLNVPNLPKIFLEKYRDKLEV